MGGCANNPAALPSDARCLLLLICLVIIVILYTFRYPLKERLWLRIFNNFNQTVINRPCSAANRARFKAFVELVDMKFSLNVFAIFANGTLHNYHSFRIVY